MAEPRSAEQPFHVALTADFYLEDGTLRYPDVGLGLLSTSPHVRLRKLTVRQDELDPQQIRGLQGVIVLSPRVTARTLSQAQDLLAIGRFGVGFDSVDVAACTAADVVLFTTAGAVDHSVAEATVTWMLALTHHLRMKDLLVRNGDWDGRSRYMGIELRGRTLGIVGFGGIGKAVAQMLAGFHMLPPLVFDPFLTPEAIEEYGARPATLDELLSEADIVSLHCPLNDRTRNLIGARELALMRPGAYLINTARGGIVEEDALFEALSSRKIAGAALDCFLGEPLRESPRWAALDNVLLAPHCIAWTQELFRDIGRAVCRGMAQLSLGQTPASVINGEVLQRESFRRKWRRLAPALKS